MSEHGVGNPLNNTKHIIIIGKHDADPLGFGGAMLSVLAFMICSLVVPMVAMGSQKSTTLGLYLCVAFWAVIFFGVYDALLMFMDVCLWWILVDTVYICGCMALYTAWYPTSTGIVHWKTAVDILKAVSSSSSTMNTPCLADYASMIPNLHNLHSCILSPFSHLQFTSFACKMLMFAGRIPHHCWNLHLCGWKPHVY